MLKQRLITAAVLIPIFVGLILWLPSAWLALLFAAVVLLGGSEWAALAGWTGGRRWGFLVALAVMLAVAYALAINGAIAWLLVPAVAGWVLVSAFLWRHREDIGGENAGDGPMCHSGCVAGVGLAVLVPSFGALFALHSSEQWGPAYMLYCLTLMWVADTSAYFVGRKFGRRKLAPAISPGKSWEGAVGAIGFCGLWAQMGYALLDAELMVGPGSFLVVSLVAVAFSIFGDLFESYAKRRSQRKDSGDLLPGHGGVLDRIDSTTAGAPVFVAGLLWVMN